MLRAYTAITYQRFWKRELDVEDLGVIEGVLEEAGARTIGFRDYVTGEGRALHDAIQHAAFEAGIFGVPTYIIDRREIFRARASSAPPLDADRSSRRAAGYCISGHIGGTRAREIDAAVGDRFQKSARISRDCSHSRDGGRTRHRMDWQPMAHQSRKNAEASARPARIAARGIGGFAPSTWKMMSCATRRIEALTIRGLRRDKDSTLAAIGLLWAKRQGASIAKRIRGERFRELFARGARLGGDERRSRICSRRSARRSPDSRHS